MVKILFLVLLLTSITVSNSFGMACSSVSEYSPGINYSGSPPSGWRITNHGNRIYHLGDMWEQSNTCQFNTVLGKWLMNDGLGKNGAFGLRTVSSIGGYDCGPTSTYSSYKKYNLTWEPCETIATCTNKQKDGDEEGIDCGGSCETPCGDYCPSGYCPISIDGNIECVAYAKPDNYGNCPSGYEVVTINTAPSGACGAEGLIPGKPACVYSVPTVPAGDPGDVPPNPPPDGYPGGDGGEENSTSTTTRTPGPGDGYTITTTTVTHNTTTNTTTTTTTNYYYSAGGELQGSDSHTTTEGGNPEDDPRNYNYNPGYNFDDSVNINSSDYGSGPDWESLKQNIDDKLNAVEDAILGTTLDADSGTCSVEFQLYGKPQQLSLCRWESFLVTAGYVLLALTYVSGMIYLWDRG